MRSTQGQNREQLEGLLHTESPEIVFYPCLWLKDERRETDLSLVLWVLCHTGLSVLCWALGGWTHHRCFNLGRLHFSLRFGRFRRLRLLLNWLLFRNRSFCRGQLDVGDSVLGFRRWLCFVAARFRTRRLHLYIRQRAGFVVEVTWLVLSGVAVHEQLRVWLLVLLLSLHSVAVHLQGVLRAQRPVEEQTGHAHFSGRLGYIVHPSWRSRDRQVSVSGTGLRGYCRGASLGVVWRAACFSMSQASVKRIQ